MSVRFRKLWEGLLVWLVLDLFMMKFGPGLPTWLAFDGTAAFGRDIWIAFFIAAMWIIYREPTSQSPAHRGDGA